MKKVIIFKEHARTYIYDASTEELLISACITVLKRRYSDSKFRYFVTGRQFNPTETEQSYMSLTEAEVDALPTAVAATTKSFRRHYKALKDSVDREHTQNLMWQKELNAFMILSSDEQIAATVTMFPDMPYQSTEPSALWLLNYRKGYAGETFEITTLDIA